MTPLWLSWMFAAHAADWTGFAADPNRPATGSTTLLVAETTERPPLFDARATMSWAHNPLVVYEAGGTYAPWVANTWTTHLSVAGGWGPLRVALSEPVAAAAGGHALEGPVVAAGDPQASARLAWRGEAAGLGVSADLTFALGGDRVWLGETGGTLGLGLLADGRAGPLLGALNLGFRGQPQRTLDASGGDPVLGQQLWARAGLSVDLKKNLAISLESQASRGFGASGETQPNALEVLLGTTLSRTSGAIVRAAAGVGVLPGVGAPAARLMIGVGRRPDQTRARPTETFVVPYSPDFLPRTITID